MNEKNGKEMEFFNLEMLKNLSAEDMERLRRELKNLNRRVREELDRRERYCVNYGDRPTPQFMALDTALLGIIS